MADLRRALVGEATILGDGWALGCKGRRGIQNDARVWSQATDARSLLPLTHESSSRNTGLCGKFPNELLRP